MNFEKVWQLYLEYYSPQKIYPEEAIPIKTPRWANSLLTHHDAYDYLLLDGFGVLNIGQSFIPHMPDMVSQLQALGKKTFVLTNSGSFPGAMHAEKYRNWHYAFPKTHIISSRDVVEASIAQHEVTQNNGLWGVISLPDVDLSSIPAQTTLLTQDTVDQVDGILFLSGLAWNNERQRMLKESLAKKLRPIMVGNPDISAPLEDGFSTEPGFYLIDLRKTFESLKVTYCGKPFKNAYDVSLERITKVIGEKVDPTKILMVGDTLHTDILGGNMAGMQTAIKIDWGFLRQQDIEVLCQEAGIYPDYIISQA